MRHPIAGNGTYSFDIVDAAFSRFAVSHPAKLREFLEHMHSRRLRISSPRSHVVTPACETPWLRPRGAGVRTHAIHRVFWSPARVYSARSSPHHRHLCPRAPPGATLDVDL